MRRKPVVVLDQSGVTLVLYEIAVYEVLARVASNRQFRRS